MIHRIMFKLSIAHSRLLLRCLSTRAEIRKSLESVKKTSVNRSAKIGEIHKRWAEFERGQIVEEGSERIKENVEYVPESMIGEMFLKFVVSWFSKKKNGLGE